MVERDCATKLVAMDEGGDQHFRAGTAGFESGKIRNIPVPVPIGGNIRSFYLHVIVVQDRRGSYVGHTRIPWIGAL